MQAYGAVLASANRVANRTWSTDLTIDLPRKTIDHPDALPFTIEIDPKLSEIERVLVSARG